MMLESNPLKSIMLVRRLAAGLAEVPDKMFAPPLTLRLAAVVANYRRSRSYWHCARKPKCSISPSRAGLDEGSPIQD